MKLQHWPKLETWFDEALDLPMSRREDYLDQTCGDDTGLRQALQRLIRADEQAGHFLTGPAWSVLTPARFEPGELVADRFAIVRLLGRGGMGEVYQADDLKLDEPVALKFLPGALASHEATLARFWQEVKIARRVTHPNVCRVFDLGEVDGDHFLSMELIDGEDLASRIRRCGQPPKSEAMEIIQQVCRGLDAIHRQGILHCDLKPANLLIDDNDHLYITDFGIAQLKDSLSDTSFRIGTPAYMAPEQFDSAKVSAGSDIYNLGLLMYELLVGERPFQGDSLAEWEQLHREVTPRQPSATVADFDFLVESTILSCLNKQSADRPSSVAQVAASLGWKLETETRSPSVPAAIHQLPPPPADFTGREADLQELRQAMEQSGVTISGLRGMGGVGKTALALKLAEEITPRYPDGQIYLDLKGVSKRPLTSTEAMGHVIHAFRPEEKLPESSSGIAVAYRTLLHERRILLFMDNAVGRDQVEPLIPPHGCMLMVTSRTSFVVPGLVAKKLGTLPEADAVTMLRRIVPGIGQEAEKIAGLCGYLPIALRLAGSVLAERPDLSPFEYCRRLAEGRGRLELIEATLSLSYELLNDDEQRLWRALAVFPDSFDLAAAAAIWYPEVKQSRDTISKFVKKGFVEWTGNRYHLHDLTRLFLEYRLPKNEFTLIQKKTSIHYLGRLEQAEALFLAGGDCVHQGLQILDVEWNHILAGQAWAAAQTSNNPTARQTASAYPIAGCYCLWYRLTPTERIRWESAGLESARLLRDHRAEGHHLAHLGGAHVATGRPDCVIKFCEQALDIAEQVGDSATMMISSKMLGLAHIERGEFRRAIESTEQSLKLAQELDDRRTEGANLSTLGGTYIARGNPGRASCFLNRAILIAHDIGNRFGESVALNHLGWAYTNLGKPHHAIESCKAALALNRELGHRLSEGQILNTLATSYAGIGNLSCAVDFAEQSLHLARETHNRYLEALTLVDLGIFHESLCNRKKAFRLLRKAIAVSSAIPDRRNMAKASWHLGLIHEQEEELDLAIELMTVCVDFEQSTHHPNAGKSARKLAKVRAALANRQELG